MNLAQCVDPQWVQDGRPLRFALLRPDGAQSPLGVLERNSDLLQVDRVRHSPEALERATERAQIRKETVAPPAPKPAPPRRSLYEARRRSESNPWPRGKGGLRYRILTLIAGSRATSVTLSDLSARSGGFSSAQVSVELRNMCLDKWLQRSGVDKHYKYALATAGRAALDWKA